jgi:hypothetical protein
MATAITIFQNLLFNAEGFTGTIEKLILGRFVEQSPERI